MPGPGNIPIKPAPMTIAELSKHFQHCELTHDDNWRSYSTRRNYKFYLERWIIPKWGNYSLDQVRTIEVESWLRGLPLARSSCAKIRNVMSFGAKEDRASCTWEKCSRSGTGFVEVGIYRASSRTAGAVGFGFSVSSHAEGVAVGRVPHASSS
jgi:hypothetical protein